MAKNMMMADPEINTVLIAGEGEPHAAETAGENPASGHLAVEVGPRNAGESFVGALHDTL